MYHFSRKELVDNVDNVDNSVKNFFKQLKNKCSCAKFRTFMGNNW